MPQMSIDGNFEEVIGEAEEDDIVTSLPAGERRRLLCNAVLAASACCGAYTLRTQAG